MTRYFAAKVAFVAFFVAGSALAAPPARGSGAQPCTHCIMMHSVKTSTAAMRGSPNGSSARPCLHQVSSKVRWGNAQKPCPHCSHMA
jgi:hypothetical protein